ncbi:hypothetical protein VHN57_08635 [Sphingobium sp. WW5]|uniref:hypothetical protein n=1 Tax=unclassified Sphingobium TaxID=2611147 RepID=UPI003C19D432
MTARLAISKDGDFSKNGLGWYGLPIDMDGLYASHFFGALHPNQPGWDYSLNDRPAKPGGPMTLRDDRFNGGWFTTSVVPADMGAGFTAALTIQPTGTQGAPIAETYMSNAPDTEGGLSMSFDASVISGAGYLGMQMRNGSDVPFATPTIPFDAATGTRPVVLFYVVQPLLVSIYEHSVGGVRAGATPIAGTGLYSDQPFVVGDNFVHTAGGAESQYAVQFFDRALSADECATVYQQIKAQMATIGVTV